MFSRTYADKQRVTHNLEKTELKFAFLMGKGDVKKRNEVRVLFGKLGCGSADMSLESCLFERKCPRKWVDRLSPAPRKPQ